MVLYPLPPQRAGDLGVRKRTVVFVIIAVLAVVALAGAAWAYWHVFVRDTAPQSTTQSHQDKSSEHTTPQLSFVDKTIKDMSLHDKVANLFMFHTPGTDPSALANYYGAHKTSGLIFMGDNVPETLHNLKTETDALVTDKQLPPLLAVDEEGDTVKRLAADNFPGAQELRNDPPEETKDAFASRSHLLRSVGLNLNFGIIADVTDDPNSFIYPRVLGTNAQDASDRVKAAVEGSKGLTLSTIKHFPGHGETPADSHTSIPTATTTFDDWKNRVSLPFKAGIDANADVVMFGHLRYTAVDSQPATLSKKWHDIIRNDLGFKGIIITDDMIMLQNSGDPAYTDLVKNAIAALQAGNDVLLYVLDHGGGNSDINPDELINGVVAAVQDGSIDQSAIEAQLKNVLSARHQLSKTFYGQM